MLRGDFSYFYQSYVTVLRQNVDEILFYRCLCIQAAALIKEANGIAGDWIMRNKMETTILGLGCGV